MSNNLRALAARRGLEDSLLSALETAANGQGTPSEAELRRLADHFRLSPAALLGTASFYDLLGPDNRARRGYVCSGTACLLGGRQAEARRHLREQLTEAEIGTLACLGRCYRGGAFQIEGRQGDAADLDGAGDQDAIPFRCAASRPVLAPGAEDDEGDLQHLARPAEAILQEVALSRLRGRGGAGFPFHRKLAALAAMPGEEKYLVANGDEGDPGAFSDRWLLEARPERVLTGLWAAGLATGAQVGVVYVRAEYPLALARIRAAIDALQGHPLVRHSGFRWVAVRGAGSYVCGEETALLNSIEGLRPEVRVRPPYPVQAGLFGRPTLVSNVETFAALPWIVRHGGGAFAAIGTPDSTGTKLVCLDHQFQRPGVLEVDLGTPLERILYDLGGGFRSPVKGLQIGGPLGAILPLSLAPQLRLDFESLAQAGFLLGHGSILAIPASFPAQDLLVHLFQFASEESCGKCVPCRLGTRRGYEWLRDATPERPLDAQAFADLLETLELGSLCALGGGLPLPVRNLISHFGDELAPLFNGGLPA